MPVNIFQNKFRIAKEGLPYIASAAAVNILLLTIYRPAGIGSFLFTIFTVFFFRDPERVTLPSDRVILSPADGCVTEAAAGRVSVYLSLLDVHVNRSPISGTVESIKYSAGKFRPAFVADRLAENENNLINITNEHTRVAVRQIAGSLARRIVCYCRERDTLKQGERIGMIKFGSCVQVYLPANATVQVRCGEKVSAGKTVLAILKI